MEISSLQRAPIFDGLSESQVGRLAGIARRRSLREGEYLFLLGEPADRLTVVLSGKVDLCFPLNFGGALTDVSVESKSPGDALGWSALVKPYRFTLSARAAESTELATFLRKDLQEIFEADPEIGYALTRRIAEVMGRRLLKIQALWARELQRALEEGQHIGPVQGETGSEASAG